MNLSDRLRAMQRPTHPSELDFFERNPSVSGMATEDNRIITNPFSSISEAERRKVMLNEGARLLMRNDADFSPDFSVTEEQDNILNGLDFYKNASPEDRKATLAGRLISGDPSAGQPTEEQGLFVKRLIQSLLGDRP